MCLQLDLLIRALPLEVPVDAASRVDRDGEDGVDRLSHCYFDFQIGGELRPW